MHLLFFSTILSLNHLTPYPSGPLSNIYIQKNTETYIPNGCSRDDALKQIINGSTWFQQSLIEKAAYNLTTSFLISPVLISIAMSLFRHGASSANQSILYRHLGIPANQCVEKVGMQALIDDLALSGLRMGRRVFASPRMQLRPAFVEAATKGFRSGIERVDFDNLTERAKFVREWCLDENDHRTLNFTDTCAPHKEMSLAITNALHLDAKWLHEFQLKDTRMRLFNGYNRVNKSLIMMETIGYFRHGSFPEINATFVELPFKTGANNMSMFVISPEKHKDTATFLESIKDLKIENLIARGSYGTITVEVPRFTIQNEVNIAMLLQANGLWTSSLKMMFEAPFNDYAGFDETVRLRFVEFVEKSVIDVSEEGVRALTMEGMSIPKITDPPPFSLICPFYFIIGTTGKNPMNLFTARFNG